MREQSNVGQRIFYTFAETLTDHAWTRDLSLQPGLAESFKRIDGRTLELKLRQNVRFHNGDAMTAEDVAFSFGPERMWTGSSVDTRGMWVNTTPGLTSWCRRRRRRRSHSRLSGLRAHGDRRQAHRALRQQGAGRHAGRPADPQQRRDLLAARFCRGGDLARLETWEAGQWENDELPTLMAVLQSSTDLEQRRATFRRMLAVTEREDPVYNVIHQNATFTAKRRDYKWRPAQSFVVDFRASNWG